MENWDFNLSGAGTERPFARYISARDKTALSRRFLVRGSKNVYFKRSGTIANRPGLLRRGSPDSTNAGVTSNTEWDTSLGKTRPIRVANAKLEVESDIVTEGTYVWYTLLDSLTATRYNFATWWDNTAKKDILIFCDGTDDLKTWSGAMGLLNSATTTSTIIGLTATAASLGFRSGGGTVTINGTNYTYTGISGSTLTGAQDATGEADGSVVIDKPATVSNTPASGFNVDFIKVINNQLYCGSDSSRLVYISKNNNYADFTFSSPRVPGEGEIITLDEIPTGIGERDGQAKIGTKKAWYSVRFSQITVSTTLTEQTIVDRIPLADKKGPLRHEFIANVGNDLVYLSQDQQLHVFGTFTDIDQPQFPSLSDDIKNELEQEDFTTGHLVAAGDFIYLTAPNNGRVWLYETRTFITDIGNISRERTWHAPFIWNVSRIAIIDSMEYGHSNANPQIYQLWDTLQWHDDGPSGESIPYDSVAILSYFSSSRFDLLTFDKIYIEGYMANGSLLSQAVSYEYQGSEGTQLYEINSEDTAPVFYSGDVGLSLGDSSLGDNPLGSATNDIETDQDFLPKFKTMINATEIECTEYQLRTFSSEAGARWEILAIGTNEQKTDQVPSFFNK